MPHNEPDPTDPMALHGVVVETQDDGAMREMAECFVEEYARAGFDSDRILRMFRTQAYAGPFLAYKTLGEDVIRAFINGQMALRRDRNTQTMPNPELDERISLPVLDS